MCLLQVLTSILKTPMKHFVTLIVFMLASLVAYAADVGNHEVNTHDSQCSLEAPGNLVIVYDYHCLDNFGSVSSLCDAAIFKHDNFVPVPASFKLPSYLNHYNTDFICHSSMQNVKWRHRQFGEIAMNLRFTSYTYKR